MRPIPIPEEVFSYSPQAWRRSAARLWLLGLCLTIALAVVATIPMLQSQNHPGTLSMIFRVGMLMAAGVACLTWFTRATPTVPRVRLAVDGITWQVGDVKRHARWDEVKSVTIQEDAAGRTQWISIHTGDGWPMVIRGFAEMEDLREHIHRGLAPGVSLHIRTTGIDWGHPAVFFLWACLPLITFTLSLAVFLGRS